MTQHQIKFVETMLRETFEDFLTKRKSTDIVVGEPHMDDRTVKLRMTKTPEELLQGSVNMNELVTELDIYSLRHSKKIILSSFSITPTMYTPAPDFKPHRGILATFRLVDKDADTKQDFSNKWCLDNF